MTMQQLKLTDLMVRDYVYLYNGKGELIDITTVNVSMLELLGKEQNIIRIAPIPLTPEILEGDGFNKVPQQGCSIPYHWTLDKYEEETNCLLYRIKAYANPFRGMYISIDNYGDCEPVNFGKQIEWLHELQHALRLCDLNELADNLKLEE